MKPALLIERWFWGEPRLNGLKLRGETGDRDRAKLGGSHLDLFEQPARGFFSSLLVIQIDDVAAQIAAEDVF